MLLLEDFWTDPQFTTAELRQAAPISPDASRYALQLLAPTLTNTSFRRYQPEDLDRNPSTGIAGREATKCNVLVRDVLLLRGASLPRGLRATQQIHFFERQNTWTREHAPEAVLAASHGELVVGGWLNPAAKMDGTGPSSHVFIVHPDSSAGGGMLVFQAGRHNMTRSPLYTAVQSLPCWFWIHTS
ncbi:MAG: hypothetical protein SFW67_35490 [Myxococcaceae bacterium]|nr:hypothetical protein [Myxococcaceae bacterium]